ncbi:hypothetical protein [Pedobacter sp. GR22-6]|uniref:hypothetical protein n=1 Tax=Pedobacter sp. GR22-6 TaxID=3127957 RepID=UPI00307EAE0F
MKTIKVPLFYLFVLLMIGGVSCRKDRPVQEQPIDESNLTDCPANATCQYLFTENVDLNPNSFSAPQQGRYRLFWAEAKQAESTMSVYVKAAMEGTKFELTKADVLAERVLLYRSCPTCMMIPFKVVDGYAKGVNMTPEKPADQTKWLLEIKLVIRYEGTSMADETVFIKQYFHPNFVYN